MDYRMTIPSATGTGSANLPYQGSDPLVQGQIAATQGAANASTIANATNPYAQQTSDDSSAVLSQTQQATNALNGAGQATAGLGGTVDASTYPSLTNSYGLGTGTGAAATTPTGSSSPSYGGTALTVSLPDTSSRGFNPWSLQGESNARGK